MCVSNHIFWQYLIKLLLIYQSDKRTKLLVARIAFYLLICYWQTKGDKWS